MIGIHCYGDDGSGTNKIIRFDELFVAAVQKLAHFRKASPEGKLKASQKKVKFKDVLAVPTSQSTRSSGSTGGSATVVSRQ